MINVTEENFKFAEKILLPEGLTFDSERRDFISNFETLDLHAVPGSGKTTALLAKLLILERYLPLSNGTGVLVISHTNNAVDEIKDKIGKHCPKLFSYPNFVGTIQSFIDIFLAIPYYTQKLKTKPYRIDNEIYDEKVKNYYKNTQNLTLKNWLNRKRDPLGFLLKLRFNKEHKLVNSLTGTPEEFELKNESTKTYKSLLAFKSNMLKYGSLHFDDAYILAQMYLDEFPNIVNVVQNRFNHVFIDEMQDMAKHQHDLLDKIFYAEGKSVSNFQRIGDKNQSIFNGDTDFESNWSERNLKLELNGSHRLSENIGAVVTKFAVSPIEVIGKRMNNDGTKINIKPHIYVYSDKRKTHVISEFTKQIKIHQEKGEIPLNPKNKFMALAWRKDHEDFSKTSLKKYWNKYSESEQKLPIDFNYLKEYLLCFDREDKSLKSIKNNIINALLKIFRKENIVDEFGQVYKKIRLINYLKYNHPVDYESFKLKLFQWSMMCIKGNGDIAYEDIKNYLPSFLSIFDSEITNSENFIEGAKTFENQTKKTDKDIQNRYVDGNVEVEIGTVHSAKGQTHTATLYLETFFYGKHESEYLKNQFVSSKKVGSAKRTIQAAKMAYVGFSRSTHLLCVAIHEDRFNKELSEIDQDVWKIVYLN